MNLKNLLKIKNGIKNMDFPPSIKNLIEYFSLLPTVGPKTAERYVFYLLQRNDEELKKFSQALAELKEKTTLCSVCCSISETNPCFICNDTKRNKNQICILSNTQEMISIESTKKYNGLYHILNGLINIVEDVNPDQLTIKELLTKIKSNQNISEVILALSPTIEGETTAIYLLKLIKQIRDLKITRLAKGLPTGSSLEYADEMTLANALEYRFNT
jgi:recombination protein RecR